MASFLGFGRLSRAERGRLFFRQAWILAALAQLALLLAMTLPFADWGESGPALVLFWIAMLLRTLSFHIGLVMLLICLLALFTRRWWLAGFTTPLALVTLLALLLPLLPKTPPDARGKPLTLCSANLLTINRNSAAMIEELRAERAEIMVFQEYSPHWHGALKTAFAKDYPHIVYVTRRDSFGAAIYAKTPFLGSRGRIRVGAMAVPTFRVSFRHDGQLFVLYNIHTLPPRRYDYVIEQRQQFRDLREHFTREQGPTIVCGDFNWTEQTGYHARMKELGFREGHELAGRGRGSTWPALGFSRFLPGIRLDHIYVKNGLAVLEHRVGRGAGSDHHPIFAKIALKGE